MSSRARAEARHPGNAGRGRSFPRRRPAGCLASVALVALWGSSAVAADRSLIGSPDPVVVRAAKACFSDTIRVTGYVVPRLETAVAMNAEGYRVGEVLAREGETVSADQDLIRLTRIGSDDPAAAQQAQAAGRGGPPSTVTLRAPAAGFISRGSAHVGAVTRPGGEPFFRLVTDATPDLIVEIPSLYVGRIKAGAAARILDEDGSDLEGSVRVPATDVDAGTQFGRARVSLPTNATFRFGAFARALIDTGESCGIGVPRTAIIRQNDATTIQVMRDGKVENRRVRVGLSSQDTVEIRDGLSEGESVVANAGTAF